MLKSSMALASIAFGLVFTSAYAQTPASPTKASCTQAEMTKMESDMAKMTNAKMKDDTTKEMMMAKKDMTGCMMHMDNAMKMMNTKLFSRLF